MAPRIEFSGRYQFANQETPEKRANNQDDPRHIFYKAMFRHDTFEEYEKDVGTTKVAIATRKGTRNVTGHAEMRYACNSGWIKGAVS